MALVTTMATALLLHAWPTGRAGIFGFPVAEFTPAIIRQARGNKATGASHNETGARQ
jgi:hypothetical protein